MQDVLQQPTSSPEVSGPTTYLTLHVASAICGVRGHQQKDQGGGSPEYFISWSAEGGAASQAVATAAAKALSEGGEPAIAVAKAFVYAIAIFSCPGVKPIIYSAF